MINQLTRNFFYRVLFFVSELSSEKINNLRLLIGQSGILASRSMSHKFKHLWDAEVKVYSQWGEDGILDYICERLELFKPKVVELGAGNFTECNSRYLAENRNASVVAIDYRSDLQKEMKKLSLMWKTHLFPVCDFITPSNIEQHLKFARKNMDGIDILSIDLDGNDFWVLNSIDFTGISVVVAEYNSLFGNEEAVSVPRDDNFDRKTKHFSCLYYGASLSAFIYILSRSGFTFLGSNRACNNAFFVKSNYVSRFSLEIPSGLEKFTDTRVRESRNQFGSLDYLSGEGRARIIKDLPLVNVETNKSCKVGDLWNFE